MHRFGYAFLLADADNTLFDFPAGERLALKETFKTHGLPTDEATLLTYHHINEALWRRLERGETSPAELRVRRFAELLAVLNLAEARSAAQIAESFVQALGRQAIMLPGAERAVRRWAARMPVAIVTNGIASVQRARMARSPIADCVAALIISEEVGAAKPDRRMVDAALDALGCADPRRALLLGDSLEADIAAAANAGIASCWFNPGRLPNPTAPHPTYTVASLDEVDALLG
ncbi:MAG: YjjG family noncanonical pyrimidine nucleotidase [Clostridia bacterium]|nr:YjjG family noncanonical pyrimidine nucleotidase [Clostridia bacterium]